MEATIKINLNLVQCESLEQARALINEFVRVISDVEVHSVKDGVLSMYGAELVEVSDKLDVLLNNDMSEVYKDALIRIHDLALGYDGATTKEALEHLIDELRMLSVLAYNEVDLRVLFHSLTEDERKEFNRLYEHAKRVGRIESVDDYYYLLTWFVKQKRPNLWIRPYLLEVLERDYGDLINEAFLQEDQV